MNRKNFLNSIIAISVGSSIPIFTGAKRENIDKLIKDELIKCPSYCYRMCYNDTGEVFNPDRSTYDIFNNKEELFDILQQINK